MRRFPLPSRLLCLSACVFALVIGWNTASAAKTHRAPRQVREQIDDMEAQFKKATLNADATLMDRLLSEDYVGISWNGQVYTKTSQLERLRKRTLVVSRLELSDVKIKLLGPVAIVTSTANVEATNDGIPMTGTFRYTRVYQRLPAGLWQITNFEATRVPNRRREYETQP